ncbi:MAG: hypothetical protein JW839_10415 [Candidatus Lokiarchaeota archaeon]|nr:hypothetical protein [Candidatus Lokiarchaeota archaeon]
MKFIIIGGIFTAEGAGSLVGGFLFNIEAALFSSMPYGGSSAAAIFTSLVWPFIIIGLASLPIGLSFLIAGSVKRKAWMAENTFE